MKSTVIVNIDASQERVAALFADPRNNPKWMDDIECYEPVSGEHGMPGSFYRLIPKRGSMVFTTKVISRNLPNDLRLRLDSSTVTVFVHATLSSPPQGRTRLVSVEVFRFKRIWDRVFGFLARPAIHKAHRRHIYAFKHFAEGHHQHNH